MWTDDRIQCPVCKSRIRVVEKICPICGFEEPNRRYKNAIDAEEWIMNTVLPCRKMFHDTADQQRIIEKRAYYEAGRICNSLALSKRPDRPCIFDGKIYITDGFRGIIYDDTEACRRFLENIQYTVNSIDWIQIFEQMLNLQSQANTENGETEQLLPAPTLEILEKEIESGKTYYDFGENHPEVDEKYLMEMLIALPESKLYCKKMPGNRLSEVVVFRSSLGNGFLLPVNKKHPGVAEK